MARFLVAPLVLVATLSPASADPSDAQVSASATSSREPDDWVQVEAPMVIAAGDDGGTTVGAAPSIAAFRDNEHGAIGARFRAGVVTDTSTDQRGAVGTLGFVFRVGVHGPWAEVGGGGGKFESFVGLSAELGAGWDFAVGSSTVSASVRFVHFDLGLSERSRTANAAMVGVGTYFGRTTPRRSVRHATVTASATP